MPNSRSLILSIGFAFAAYAAWIGYNGYDEVLEASKKAGITGDVVYLRIIALQLRLTFRSLALDELACGTSGVTQNSLDKLPIWICSDDTTW